MLKYYWVLYSHMYILVARWHLYCRSCTPVFYYGSVVAAIAMFSVHNWIAQTYSPCFYMTPKYGRCYDWKQRQWEYFMEKFYIRSSVLIGNNFRIQLKRELNDFLNDLGVIYCTTEVAKMTRSCIERCSSTASFWKRELADVDEESYHWLPVSRRALSRYDWKVMLGKVKIWHTCC